MTRTWPLVCWHLAKCLHLTALLCRLRRINERMFSFLVYKWPLPGGAGLMIPCTHVCLVWQLFKFHWSNIFQLQWGHPDSHRKEVHREVEVLRYLLSVLKFSVSSRSSFNWLDNRVFGSLFLEQLTQIGDPIGFKSKTGPLCAEQPTEWIWFSLICPQPCFLACTLSWVKMCPEKLCVSRV